MKNQEFQKTLNTDPILVVVVKNKQTKTRKKNNRMKIIRKIWCPIIIFTNR